MNKLIRIISSATPQIIVLSMVLLTGCRTIGSIGPVLSNVPVRTSSTNNNNPAIQEYTSTTKDHDYLTPDIDGYKSVSHSRELLTEDLEEKNIIEYMAKVKQLDAANKDCKKVQKLKIYFDNEDDIIRFHQYITVKNFGNSFFIQNKKIKKNKILVDSTTYKCKEVATRANPTFRILNNRSSVEFDIMMGSYVNRTGFLKYLGETGPTVGATFQYFSKSNLNLLGAVDFGWHIHFNFDHFFDTDSKLLKPKFINEDYTNYLWSFGPSLRYIHDKNFQVNYNIGLGINFLEIDTGRTNTELSNDEATQTTISLVHQIGFYYRVRNQLKYNKILNSDGLIGLNVLYYWMPNALGKFAANNTDFNRYDGGSYAIMLSYKIQAL